MNKIVLLCTFVASVACAQKQLVILKRQEVVKRYNPGDAIVFKIKGHPEVHSSYVNNLSDTSLVIRHDTITYHQIERVYFKKHSFLNTIGKFLVIAGTGFFLIDQFNNVIVHGNDPRIDSYVIRRSIPMLAAGLPLYLIHKKSRRMGRKYRILFADENSIFYRDNKPSAYQSPYLPN